MQRPNGTNLLPAMPVEDFENLIDGFRAVGRLRMELHIATEVFDFFLH